jgi:hypothetical protein
LNGKANYKNYICQELFQLDTKLGGFHFHDNLPSYLCERYWIRTSDPHPVKVVL